MEIPRNSEVTYFAKTNFRGQEKQFGIRRKDRRQHMYLLGKSGTGKSVMLKNMIVQNIANGEGLAVVDPHGELAEEVLELIPENRKADVVYFNPADTEFHIGFNVLEVPDLKYKHLIAAGLMSVFTKIWANAWSARMEYIMNNAILALVDTPGSTMLGIPRLLVDQNYRQKIIANVTDPVVRAFWVNEYESWQDRFRNEAIAPIQNKVGQFLSTSIIRNIVGQSKSTINIFDIMNNKKILIVNVSKGRIGEDNSALLGAMLITKIQLAAMERVRIPEEERKDFYLYVDEFQNFVTESFAGILSEARKYRLCLCIAHQYIAQLNTVDSTTVRDAVFGNVGTMAIFRIGGADAEFIEQEFTPELEAQDFVNLPNYQVYLRLMVDGVTSRPFSAKTLPPFHIEGSKNIAREIIQASRDNYAIERSKVEKEIEDWSTGKSDNKEDGDDISDNAENAKPDAQGNYKVRCSFKDCRNIAIVPFKPERGRPVYCKEHIEKIKSGEAEPIKVKPFRNKATDESIAALTSIGIAFDPAQQKTPPKPFTASPSSRDVKKDFKQDFKKDFKKDFSKERPTTPRENIPPRRVHIAKEEPVKTARDTEGLKSILGSIFNKPTSPASQVIQETPKENNIQQKPQETISLSSLQKSLTEPSSKSSSEEVKMPTNDRIAKPASQNALAEALQFVKKQETASKLEELGNKILLEEKESQEQDGGTALLAKMKEEAERKAERARQEIEDERKRREIMEQEMKIHADRLVTEERRRRELEQEAEDIKKKLHEIEEQKKRVEQEMREKDANEKTLRGERDQLEQARATAEIEKQQIMSEKDLVKAQVEKLERERKQLEEDKKHLESHTHILVQEKEERQKRDAEEKARKEVPEDILNQILD